MLATKLPVFAINLDASRNRWDSLLECASNLSVDLHRVSAIDGRDVKPEDWASFDSLEFKQKTGREPLAGEYGCYQSHIRALQTFIDHKAPYGIIIEDDVLLSAQGEARINSLIEAMPSFDVVRLISHRSNWFVNFLTTDLADQVGRTIFGPQGSAAAYLVSRNGAQKMLSAMSTMCLPWDVELERFWAHNTITFSTKENIFDFSSHRSNSSIVGQNGYDATKFWWPKRLGALIFQINESFVRAHHVLLAPKLEIETSQNEKSDTSGNIGVHSEQLMFLGGALLMMFLSAVWFETDAYRYAGILMVITALIHYWRYDFFTYGKPLIGIVGLACVAWTIYILVRMGHAYVESPGKRFGTAEGIYLLPLLYPSFGYALYILRRNSFQFVVVFMLISLSVLLFSTDFHRIFLGERVVATLHNNPIHSANASGIMMICALAFGNYLLHAHDVNMKIRNLLLLAAAAVFSIAGLNVIGLQSKGVWFALIISLPLLFAITSLDRRNRHGRIIALCVLSCVFVAAAFFGEKIYKVGEKTFNDVIFIGYKVVQGENISSVVSAKILDENSSPSVSARLMIWSNAMEVWQKQPVFGSGVAWLDEWEHRTYQDVSFTLLHNSYLEIGVRYGIAGLLFYALLFLWSLITVRKAVSADLIDRTAYHAYAALMTFFAISVFTNSNNRLAFGETYMWFAVGFAFYCQYGLQQINCVKPRTYI